MHRNRKILYRRLSATALSLFAALAFAPEVVFHSAKPISPLAKAGEHHVSAKAEGTQPRQPAAAPQPHSEPKSEPSQQPAAEGFPDEQDTDFASTAPVGGNGFDTTTFGDEPWIPAPLWASFGPRFSGGSGSPIPINSLLASNTTTAKPVIGTSRPGPSGGGDSHNGQPGQPNNNPPSNNNPPNSNNPPSTNDLANNGSPSTGNPPSNDDHQPPATDPSKPDTDSHTRPGDSDPRPVVTVPEPSSLALLAAGIIGLVIVRRRFA